MTLSGQQTQLTDCRIAEAWHAGMTGALVVCCRVSALSLMAQAVHRLDKEAAGSMLDVCTQVKMRQACDSH
jgi:23S rRNA-/tRNA-specific pseudouridylate synthase